MGTSTIASGDSYISGGTGSVVGPVLSTDNAVARFDGVTGLIIQNSGVIVDDSNNVSGVANFTIATGGAFRPDTTTAHTALLQAYDVDGTAYKTFATLTNANTPTFNIAAPSGGTINIDGAVIGATTVANAQFQSPVNVQTGTTYTVVASDCGKIITFNNAAAIAVTLPQQSTTTTAAGFWFDYEVIGAGTVTFAKEGAETLTGNATAVTGASGKFWRNTTTNWNNFGGSAITTFSFEKTFQAFVGTDVRYFTTAAPCAGTIIDCSQVAQSLGTAGTYTVAISGSNVTGLTTVTNTTSKTTTAASGANTFVYGDTITVTFTSTVSGVNWEGTIRYTRAL